MVLVVGTGVVFHPLTRALYDRGEGETRCGTIEELGDIHGDPTGVMVFVSEDRQHYFVHPSFLREIALMIAPSDKVQIALSSTGMLVATRWTEEQVLERMPLAEAPPAETTYTTTENISAFLAIALRQKGRCAHPECAGARGRELDTQRAVLITRYVDRRPEVLCGHCFDKIPKPQMRPHGDIELVFDGRKLMPHAPVVIYR